MFPVKQRFLPFAPGFTLVELLTVIALIIAVAALAVPNFGAMLREQRMTSAINACQIAIMRARSYAINNELDAAVEFCTNTDGETYLRIEAESAYLESIPNLQSYISVADSLLYIPDSWVENFMARRDAWGASDGKRLYTGIINIKWPSDQVFGHFPANDNFASGFGGLSSVNMCRMYYDENAPAGRTAVPQAYFSKSNDQYFAPLLATWKHPTYPTHGSGRTMSLDEATNLAGTQGYRDVNDGNPFSPNSGGTVYRVQDNLVVDDQMYLPYDIQIWLPGSGGTGPVSSLINFDAPSLAGRTVLDHGWDNTKDLRFGKSGHLLQAQTPVIVLKRKDLEQYVQLQLLRGTTRLKRYQEK